MGLRSQTTPDTGSDVLIYPTDRSADFCMCVKTEPESQRSLR